ncbi:hypothetical protein GGI23_000405 [Coemansia sp. RSA 2559]|nr:hypothetical protein GGI23_000405 [Coemansia sp. RSA 2559]KAJ2869341.1 hypothetical protein GGI22_000321 [Coemansia erecta]
MHSGEDNSNEPTIQLDKGAHLKEGKAKDSTPKIQPMMEPREVLKHLHRLKPKFRRMGTNQTGIYRAPSMLSHTSGNLALETMLAAGMHLGHSASLWHPLNLPYIFGEREGIHIINLERTIAALRRAAHMVNRVAYHGGIILFTGVRKDHRQLAVDAALHADQYYFARHWIGGTLTNAGSVLGRHCGYADEVWDVEEARDFAHYKTTAEREKSASMTDKQKRVVKNAREEKAKLVAEAGTKLYKPDLVVALNPLESKTMLVESRMSFVPTVGIVDTNCDPRIVTYPIPCNDDSLRAVTIVAGVLARAARDGLELRRHRLKSAAAAHGQAEIDKAVAKSQRPEALRKEEGEGEETSPETT